MPAQLPLGFLPYDSGEEPPQVGKLPQTAPGIWARSRKRIVSSAMRAITRLESDKVSARVQLPAITLETPRDAMTVGEQA